MPMTKIDWPTTGAGTWTDAIDIWKDWMTGVIRLSLTNYDSDSAPQITQGSLMDLGGSYFYAATAQTPTGSPSSNVFNYIYVETDGDVKWSTTAPTWNDAQQAWINGTDRAVGGCWYDGTNYRAKWVYTNQHAGPQPRTIDVPMTGSSEDLTDAEGEGGGINFTNAGGAAVSLFCPLPYMDKFYVESLITYSYSQTGGTLTVYLREGSLTATGGTAMASNAHSSSGILTDTSITSPFMMYEDHQYYIEAECDSTGFGWIARITITGQQVIRC